MNDSTNAITIIGAQDDAAKTAAGLATAVDLLMTNCLMSKDLMRAVDAIRAAQAAPSVDREKLSELIAENMGYGVYYCNRHWDAWQRGTMRADDFYPAGETEVPQNIADAVICAAIAAATN